MRWFDTLMMRGPRGLLSYVRMRYFRRRRDQSVEPVDLGLYLGIVQPPPTEILFSFCVVAVAEGQVPSPAILTPQLLKECSPDPVEAGLAERAWEEAHAKLRASAYLRRGQEGLSYFHCGSKKRLAAVVMETKGKEDPIRMTAFSPFRYRLYDLKKRLEGWRLAPARS